LERISKHPLLRAVRVDKMTLAALEATLRIYLEDRAGELPLWNMATESFEDLERRAQAVATSIGGELDASGVKAEAVPSISVTGGGSLPGTEVPSWAVALVHPTMTASEIARALRRAETPVIARVDDETVLLDVRTIDPRDDARLASMVVSVLRG
jgi:L-seryl-tRNA(Ser) seleniumtransferase